ncbi:MAG: response regulator [Nitrospirae bacterium]|nr:response regulator [Nitrospirota bacterium]MBF0590537.1 response regulator [Nitrospirota bacterium]
MNIAGRQGQQIKGNPAVLVVEDDVLIARGIQESLRGLGYTVMAIVSSGEDVLQYLTQRRPEMALPDVILMDIRLQGKMDGIETAGHIRDQYDIPLIYLTGSADEETLQRAKITEPFGYMLKPFEDRELHSNIEMALYKHKLQRKLRESQQWLSIILNSIGDAVIAIDVNGNVTFMNPAAQYITGCPEEKTYGRPLSEVFTIKRNDNSEMFTLKSLINNEMIDLTDHVLLLPNGQLLTIYGSASPIKDDNDGFMGIVITFQNLTELRQVQERLSNQRERFISVLIHDLKTPLIAISGYTKRFLLGKAKNDEDKVKIVSNIQNISDYLLSTIEETSRLLKEKADLNSFSPQYLQFNKILTAAIMNCLPEMESRRVSLIVNNHETVHHSNIAHITMSGDQRQLITMIENLLGNATKYAKSSIQVSCYKEGMNVRLTITDDGPGIEDFYIDKIFDPYYQVPGSLKGTGLGLYSVKKVVENHKGSICVKSFVNVGSTFEVTLPCDL